MSTLSKTGKISQYISPIILITVLFAVSLMPKLAWGIQNAPDAWRLQVRSAAVAQGQHVLLSEIVNLVGQVPEKVKRDLATVQLWKSPESQRHQQAVSNEQLQKLIEYYAPQYAPACVYPSRLVVQRGGKVLDRPEIEKLVVDFLTPRLAKHNAELRFRNFRLPKYIFLSDAMDSVEIKATSALEPGSIAIMLYVKGLDGRINSQLAASLFVDLWQTIPCAARPINRLEELTPSKVTFIKKNLAFVKTPWDGKSGPFRLKRPVGTGQPLVQENLESVPVVAKGEQVDLVYQGKRIRLVTKAMALSDAEFGDRIEVRNLQSKKIVLATVLDASTVIVR